ncbi:MAG TPA: hypothetical protein GX702_08195, partial [Chloroflexi bacterium]|nr:hypothetical protein [Chloroflexota bacterium]
SVLLGRRQGPRIERLKVAMLMLNTALGVLVLLLSAFNAALSAGAPPA